MLPTKDKLEININIYEKKRNHGIGNLAWIYFTDIKCKVQTILNVSNEMKK